MEDKQAKIETYEHFVNEKLRSDLAQVLADQDLIYSDIAEYLQIKDTIEKIDQAKQSDHGLNEPFKTRIDLGCNFYAKAVVEDTSKIFISIGYGFHLEMTHLEALKFIEKKNKSLYSVAEQLTDKANEIKANIKFVVAGLKEIQQFKDTDTKK